MDQDERDCVIFWAIVLFVATLGSIAGCIIVDFAKWVWLS